MSRYSSRRQPPPRKRRGLGCLTSVVLLVWLLVALVLVYNNFLRPQISQMIGDQIVDRVDPPAPGNGPGGVTDELSQEANEALPAVIAALPSGEVRISEQQANEFLAARGLGPIDTANVRFLPGQIVIEMSAFGISSTAHSGLAVQNGRVITVDPQIDGPLGQLISLKDLAASVEQQLNDQLAIQDRRISEVRVEEGEMIVTIE